MHNPLIEPLSEEGRGRRPPRTGVTGSSETAEEITGNSGPLQTQHASWTSEPSLQPQSQISNGA